MLQGVIEFEKGGHHEHRRTAEPRGLHKKRARFNNGEDYKNRGEETEEWWSGESHRHARDFASGSKEQNGELTAR
jgi:hypothetical protein